LQSEKIPLVFVQDVTGFMVGSKSEQGGIIKRCKMVNAVSNSVVPKFTVIVGNSMVLEILCVENIRPKVNLRLAKC
jgi:acetyl-CoA carboxylase carboxyltransferase component